MHKAQWKLLSESFAFIKDTKCILSGIIFQTLLYKSVNKFIRQNKLLKFIYKSKVRYNISTQYNFAGFCGVDRREFTNGGCESEVGEENLNFLLKK